MARHAWGVGLATIAADGTTLDTFYRHLGWGDAVPAGTPVESKSVTDERRGIVITPVSIVVDTEAAPTSASDVYLRLHLLSHRLAVPRSVNLDGAFGLLANVAWTSLGPVALNQLDDVRYNQLRQGELVDAMHDEVFALAQLVVANVIELVERDGAQ